jgi:maltose/moltooligosaccharide transporter
LDIKEAFVTMPLTMRQLIPVKFFTWYAMFCYWQYITSTLSISIFHTTDQASKGFSKAQLLTGNLNGTYNIICFLVAFALVPLALKIGAKGVHCIALLLGGLGLLAVPYLNNTDVLFHVYNPFGGSVAISTIYLYSFGLGNFLGFNDGYAVSVISRFYPQRKTEVFTWGFSICLLSFQWRFKY